MSNARNHQRRAVYKLFMLSLSLFLFTWFWKTDPGEGPATGEGPPADAPPADVPPAAPDTPGETAPEARAPRSLKPGARTPVPRPVVTQTHGPGGTPEADAPEDAPPAGLVDKREAPGPDGQELVAAIQETMGEVKPAIEDCLIQWWMLDPALEGEVKMSFQLGPEGLGEVEVLDHSEVPVGPLSCFGSALYEAEWPESEEPLQVTFPFVFFSEEER